METSTYEYKFPPCAPWIPNQSRVIAMWEGDSFVKTWDEFQAGKNYLGGEAYWSASLDFALKKLGFRVVKRKLDHSLLADIADGKVYKFIRNGLAQENLEAAANSPLFQNANITCRIHWLHWWDRFDPDFQVFPSTPLSLESIHGISCLQTPPQGAQTQTTLLCTTLFTARSPCPRSPKEDTRSPGLDFY
jgi:hypothetical protein